MSIAHSRSGRMAPGLWMHGAKASRRFSRLGAIYLAALPGQLELETSSGCAPVNAAAAVGSLRS
jgi:hypothetical protein